MSEDSNSSPQTSPIEKKSRTGCLWAVLIVFAIVCVNCCLGPITPSLRKAKESAAMQTARAIAVAMQAYANDHNGVYPDGKTSTEVFQRLLDEKYVADPDMFYLWVPGKTKATSNKLTADNVCFDVTSGVTADSPEGLPLVFTTGFTITYSAGATATRVSDSQNWLGGIAMGYKSQMARFYEARPDGTLPPIISTDFDPGTKNYRQLKP